MACNALHISLLRTNCRILCNVKQFSCSAFPLTSPHGQTRQFSSVVSNNNNSPLQLAAPSSPMVWTCRTAATKPVSFIKDLVDNYKFKSALKKVGFLNVRRSSLKRKGYVIYEHIADNVDYKAFFTKFNLPDTFNSWFVVMELHLWMVIVRLMTEEEEGRFLRNCAIEALWEDIKEKTGLLGEEHVSTAREQMKLLSEEFQAALLSYDEGLLSDDMVLAGALWRRFFSKECNEPELLEELVKYVRKQVKLFDTLTREDVLDNRNTFFFEPIDKKSNTKSI